MKGMEAGDVEMTRDGKVSGMVAGDVFVRAGCRVKVSGMVAGNVIVEPDAAVRVTGMVGGRVINRGGDVTVSGMVVGH